MKITLAISAGCPCGIGPEVSVAAASELVSVDPDVEVVLFGDQTAIARAASVRGIVLADYPRIRVSVVSTLGPEEVSRAEPSAVAGRSQLRAIDDALALVVSGDADALVTGPASKQAITASGTPFLGHTEYLAEQLGHRRPVMFFVGPSLRASLVTTHLALQAVPAALTVPRVLECVIATARGVWRDFGIQQPRIVVCGLNPHAGEGGLLGDEEIRVISPAVVESREVLKGIAEVVGPLPAEAAFRLAKDGKFDAVVAMYHDQATIPMKLLDFGEAVNVTLGLPVVRTSVDHGTAYDLAYSGRADARGMYAALKVAIEMVRARRAGVHR
ncbi:MAG: 4-hydroxythreonine-4-phosphate dehydrogenase PdxA [Deltaproteobacteria bacterium]|nr:4-hydroxythreonine-4-phosphate dehydrogenase PdxA [Deltaproteobacteria bacterium]